MPILNATITNLTTGVVTVDSDVTKLVDHMLLMHDLHGDAFRVVVLDHEGPLMDRYVGSTTAIYEFDADLQGPEVDEPEVTYSEAADMLFCGNCGPAGCYCDWADQ